MPWKYVLVVRENVNFGKPSITVAYLVVVGGCVFSVAMMDLKDKFS